MFESGIHCSFGTCMMWIQVALYFFERWSESRFFWELATVFCRMRSISHSVYRNPISFKRLDFQQRFALERRSFVSSVGTVGKIGEDSENVIPWCRIHCPR